MTEMIEKVARAIVKEDGSFTVIDYHRGLARAAIEAMREPTEAMLSAARKQHDLVGTWQAMIEAALIGEKQSA